MANAIDKDIKRIKQLTNEIKTLDETISKLSIAYNTAFTSGTDFKTLGGQLEQLNKKTKALKQEQLGLINSFKNNKGLNVQQAELTAQEQALNSLLNTTRNYIKEQETLSGKKIPIIDQISYYTQQLVKFTAGSKQHIAVLQLLRAAQDKLASNTSSSAQKQSSAYDSVLKSIYRVSIGINSTINKIIMFIRTGLSIINKAVKITVSVFSKLGQGVKSLISIFGNLGNRVKGQASGFNAISGSATELYSKLMLVSKAYNALFSNQLIDKGKQLISTTYSLRTIIDGINGEKLSNTADASGKSFAMSTQELIDFSNQLERAFGISSTQFLTNMQEISAVMYGLGLHSNHVAEASASLSIIGQHLANLGFASGDFDAVMTKISSGMRGMTQSIDDLGISVREAEMDSFLKKLKEQGGEYANIETSFAKLNEEARVYIRYAAIIEQYTSSYDISNYVSSLETVTGKISIMSGTWSKMLTTIGTGLTVIASRIAGILAPVIDWLTAKIIKLFSWLGVDAELGIELNTQDINKDTDKIVSDVENKEPELKLDTDKAVEGLNEVEEAATKAKGALFGFDNITVLDTKVDTGGIGGLVSGLEDAFDYSSLMNGLTADIDKLMSDATSDYFDNARSEMLKNLSNMETDLTDFAKKITGRDDLDFEFDFVANYDSLKNIFNNTWKLIKNTGEFILNIAFRIADDVNIGAILTEVLKTIDTIVKTANRLSPALFEGLADIYDRLLAPVITNLGKLFIAWLKDIQTWFNGLTVDDINNGLKIFEGILGDIINIGGTAASIVGNLVKEFIKFAGDELLPWIINKLGEFANWFKDNEDDITQFLKDISSFTWTSFKVFVDLMSKLVDMVVNGGFDGLITALTAIAGIKIGSGIVGGLAKLGMAKQGLGSLFSKGGAATAATTATTATAGSSVATSAGTAVASSGAASLVGTLGVLASSLYGVKIGIEGVIDSTEGLFNTSNDLSKTIGAIKIVEDLGLKAHEDVIQWTDDGILRYTAVVKEAGNTTNVIKSLVSGAGVDITTLNDTTLNELYNLFTELSNKYGIEFAKMNGDTMLFTQETINELHRLTSDGTINITELVNSYTQSVDQFLGNSANKTEANIKNSTTAIEGFVDNTNTEIINTTSVANKSIEDILNNSANKTSDNISGLVDNTDEAISNIQSLFVNLGNSVGSIFSNISNAASGVYSNIKGLFSGVGNWIGDQLSFDVKVPSRSKGMSDPLFSSSRNITTNANGGSIAGGQLFIANEGGKAELIGKIDGSGKTNVANNEMIIDGIKRATMEGNLVVVNILTRILDTLSKNNTHNIASSNPDTILSMFSGILSPYLSAQNSNGINYNFST